jgi:hypothetical protein
VKQILITVHQFALCRAHFLHPDIERRSCAGRCDRHGSARVFQATSAKAQDPEPMEPESCRYRPGAKAVTDPVSIRGARQRHATLACVLPRQSKNRETGTSHLSLAPGLSPTTGVISSHSQT